MRSRALLVLATSIATAALISGCGEGGSSASAPQESSGPDRPSSVKLLDAGSEPRQRLRLRPQVGDAQRALISTQTSGTMTIDGQAVPTGVIPEIVIGSQTEVERVSEDGAIDSTFVYDDVRVAGSGNQADQLSDILEKNLVGVKGRLEIYDTGEFIDGSLELPTGIDPALRSTLRSFEAELRNLTVPFPVEEVGVGATWTYETRSAVNDIEVDTTFRFEILELSGGQVVLETTSTGEAAQQKVRIPGVPAGADFRLERMSLSGRGSSTIDLTKLLPIAMTNAVDGDVVMNVKQGGSTSSVLQVLRIRTGIEPG